MPLGRFGLEDIGVRMVIENLSGFKAGMKQMDAAVGNSIGALERYQASADDTAVALEDVGLSAKAMIQDLDENRKTLRAVGVAMLTVGVGALKLTSDVDTLTAKWGDNLTMVERMRVGLGRMLDPFKALFQLMTGLAPLLLILSTRWGAHAAAQVVSTLATVAHTAAMRAFGLSAAAAAVAVRTLMGVLGLLAGVVTIAVLMWNNAEEKKREALLKTTQAVKDAADEQKQAMLANLDEQTQKVEDTYAKASDAVRDYYGDIEQMDMSLAAQRRRQYDQSLALIDAELEATLEAKRKEYDAELALIDLRLSEALGPLQARLDAMEAQMTEEERLRADRLDAERIAELEAMIAAAKTEDEKQKYRDQIADIEEQTNWRHQRQMYEDKRDAILAEMDDLRAAADEKRQIAEQEYQERLTLVQQEVDERKAILADELQGDLARISQREQFAQAQVQSTYDKEVKLLEDRKTAYQEFYDWLAKLEEEYGAKHLSRVLSGMKDLDSLIPGFSKLYAPTPGEDIHQLPENPLWSLLGKMFGGRQYGGPAAGPTWVGERGRELVYMPQGSQVIPNSTVNYNVTANYLNQQQPTSIGMDLEAIRMMSRV